MSCKVCEFEELSENERVCTKCGYISREEEQEINYYFGDEKYERCVTYERQMNNTIQKYMRSYWSGENYNNIHEKILEHLEEKRMKITEIDKGTLFGVIVKYMSENKIACNIREHSEGMDMITKGRIRSIKQLKEGIVISEGLTSSFVQDYISKFGDTGNICPKSLETLSEKMKIDDYEVRQYTHAEPLSNVVALFPCIESDELVDKVIYVYGRLDVKRYGDAVCALISVYVVLENHYGKKHGNVPKLSALCKMTRLTCYPTLKKCLKENQKLIDGVIKNIQ